MKSKKSLWKRGLAVCMMTVMAFMLPATPLYDSEVKAAEVRSAGEYIKEVKLFLAKEGSIADAEAWCEKQGDGWKVLKGDKDANYDLNSGASGAFTKEVGVFMCYRTTTDPEEAITDLAVMNEKGNYSVGDYETLLKNQKEKYIDMVKNMRDMINEYKKNYENKVPMAVKSHDFLNAYKEDDSGQLLGDFLLTADDEKIAEMLLQCNGLIVLTMQEKLAAACDTAKTTWLDRMMKLGSYDKLKSAFSRNIKSGDIEKTLEKQYSEKAKRILDNWDALHKHFESFKTFSEKNGLVGASKEQYEEWFKNADLVNNEYRDIVSLPSLIAYKYGDKTLFEFFGKTKEQVEKDGLETLYPMAACLTNGQIAALSESMGLYQLIVDALAANVVNDKDTGIMTELKKDGALKENEIKEEITEVDKMVDIIKDGTPVSIYEGVDRDVFKGGVAVTTDAKSASEGAESSWTKAFYVDGAPTKLSIGLGIATASTAVLACAFGVAAILQRNFEIANHLESIFEEGADKLFSAGTVHFIKMNHITTTAQYFKKVKDATSTSTYVPEMVKDMNKVLKEKGSIYLKGLNFLKWGMTVFTILLSAGDIAVSVYSLYKYYNGDHFPIPHHIVDQTYSETQEASYVAYKAVTDQNGNSGDLNGGNAKQWLALYYTKDRKAGNPILAPTEGGKEMIVKVGNAEAPGTGYSPLHMFGIKNTAQNLTFADGESGYSFNDKNGGTYLYFTHSNAVTVYTDKADEVKVVDKDSKDADATVVEAEPVSAQATSVQEEKVADALAVEAEQTGTSTSGGTMVLFAAIGVVVGGVGGFLIADNRRKRMIRKEEGKH